MANIKVVLRKNKIRKDDTIPLAIRITKDRKSKFIFLKQYIHEKDWDENKGRVKKSHPTYKRINNLIIKKLAEADDLVLENESTDKNLSLDQIKQNLTKNRKNAKSFFAYADSYLEDLKIQNKHNSYIAEKPRINHFKEFAGRDLTFNDITVAVLNKYKVYLKGTYDHSDRTVMNHLAIIRTIYNHAIKEGIAEKKNYPFGGENVKIKMPSTLKIGLEKEEIQKIEDLDLEVGSTIWHTRNVFLFSFYFAGMRISDVLRVKWKDLQNDRLNYTMGKNNKSGSVKITEKVENIIKLYEKDKKNKNDYVFPELKSANPKDKEDIYRKIKTASRKFNKYLKRIGEQAKIEKNISNHISRHSFGNIAGEKIPIQMLQKLYRHSDIKTTVMYQSNFMFKDTDDALESVIS